MNFAIGLGTFIVASLMFAFQAAIGLAGVAFGLFGIINAFRRRVKSYITYAIFAAILYVCGHIVIAYFCPVYFSYMTSVWTLLWVGGSALFLWTQGGLPLDLTLLVSKLPQAQFDRLIDWIKLDESDAEDALEEASMFPLIDTLRHLLEDLRSYPRNLVVITLTMWRTMGKGFLEFLEKIHLIGALVGLYFLWFPPSNNWRMFWVILVSFTAYAISGPGFNKKKWQKVSLASVIVSVIISTATPWVAEFRSYWNTDWDYENWMTFGFGLLAIWLVLNIVVSVLSAFSGNGTAPASTTTAQGDSHAQSH